MAKLHQNNSRKTLQRYFEAGGNQRGFGRFCGIVMKIDNDGEHDWILFKHLTIQYTDPQGTIHYGGEDHIWMWDVQPFLDQHVELGTQCTFTAKAYQYQRTDQTTDFSLQSPNIISLDFPAPSGIPVSPNIWTKSEQKETNSEREQYQQLWNMMQICNKQAGVIISEGSDLLKQRPNWDKSVRKQFRDNPDCWNVLLQMIPKGPHLGLLVYNRYGLAEGYPPGLLYFSKTSKIPHSALREGDRILQLNGMPVRTQDDMKQALALSEDTSSQISVQRNRIVRWRSVSRDMEEAVMSQKTVWVPALSREDLASLWFSSIPFSVWELDTLLYLQTGHHILANFAI